MRSKSGAFGTRRQQRRDGVDALERFVALVHARVQTLVTEVETLKLVADLHDHRGHLIAAQGRVVWHISSYSPVERGGICFVATLSRSLFHCRERSRIWNSLFVAVDTYKQQVLTN